MNNLEFDTMTAVRRAAHKYASIEEKRFIAASKIMASIAPTWDGTDEDLANASVSMADALLSALRDE